jgi:uncharacterized protein (TIGR03083 family)
VTESTLRTTLLAPDRYLALIAADGARLADVAEGHLDDPVPPCPGWTVTDLVTHTGEVYNEKVACTLLGRRPGPDEYEKGPAEGQDLLEWFRAAHATLIETLGSRPADSHSFTWYDPDQTVGFWLRRMAQETVVHRVDAESASEQVTAADDELAIDGIDEVLHLFLSYAVGQDPDEDIAAYAGRSLLVRTGPWAWQLTVDTSDPADKIRLTRSAGPAQATVTGEPSELLLWLWGRRPDSAVTIHGDASAVVAMRELLIRGTQ